MLRPQLGVLPLNDYLRIVRPRGGWRRRFGALLAGLACILCFCAGRFGPWSGKGTASLSLSDALGILDQAPAETWEHELGVYAVHRNVARALDVLAEVSHQPTTAGRDATVNLRHLARRAIRHVRGSIELSQHVELNTDTLRILRDDLNQ